MYQTDTVPNVVELIFHFFNLNLLLPLKEQDLNQSEKSFILISGPTGVLTISICAAKSQSLKVGQLKDYRFFEHYFL